MELKICDNHTDKSNKEEEEKKQDQEERYFKPREFVGSITEVKKRHHCSMWGLISLSVHTKTSSGPMDAGRNKPPGEHPKAWITHSVAVSRSAGRKEMFSSAAHPVEGGLQMKLKED